VSIASSQGRPKRTTITDPGLIKALFDTNQRTMLAPFFARPVSVGEAAELTDSLSTTMLYFVRRMTTAGVLLHVDSVRRSSRRVKRYTTAADEFYVPIEAIEEELLGPQRRFQSAFNEALQTEVIRYNYEVEPTGALIRVLPTGAIQLTGALGEKDWIPGENGPAVMFDWAIVALSTESARMFQRELFALTKRYQQLPPGGTPHYVGIHFAPIPTSHRVGQIANGCVKDDNDLRLIS
jgi:hypothetical protein